jgi:hypothetical protein
MTVHMIASVIHTSDSALRAVLHSLPPKESCQAPDCLLPWLQAAIAEAEAADRPEEVARWRKRLHGYLDALFRRDASAGADFADLQVHLADEHWTKRCMHASRRQTANTAQFAGSATAAVADMAPL